MSEVSKIEKPWGAEFILDTSPQYTLKKLFIKEGCRTSLQYHEKKRETIFVLTGKLKLYLGSDKDNLYSFIMNPEDVFVITPNGIHRMEGETDCYYLEASTSELDDVVRIEDDFGRV